MVCKAWALIKPPKPILASNKPLQIEVKSGSFTKLDVPEKMERRFQTIQNLPFFLVGGLNPISKIFVKLAHHFPEFRGEHTKNRWNHYHFWMSFFSGEGEDFQLVPHHGVNRNFTGNIPWGSQLFDAQDAIEVVIRLLPYALSIHLPTAVEPRPV